MVEKEIRVEDQIGLGFLYATLNLREKEASGEECPRPPLE